MSFPRYAISLAWGAFEPMHMFETQQSDQTKPSLTRQHHGSSHLVAYVWALGELRGKGEREMSGRSATSTVGSHIKPHI